MILQTKLLKKVNILKLILILLSPVLYWKTGICSKAFNYIDSKRLIKYLISMEEILIKASEYGG